MGQDAVVTGRRAEFWVLFATILGSGMVFVDSSAINVAIPVIQTDLGASVSQLQWIVEAYLLFLSALLLVGGVLGDRFGRRRMFVWGLVLFTTASVACGLAQTSLQLIVGRGLQGIGAAILTPGSLAIISASFADDRRGRAIGTWAAFSGLTAVLGPVLGGYLTDAISWRAIFFINVPLAMMALWITASRVPESRDEEREPGIDVAGAITVTLGLAGIVFALIEGPVRGWRDPLVALAGVAGALLLAAFIRVQQWRHEPMVPLGLFRQRTFAASNAATVFIYGALYGALFFLPLNLIHVQGYSATAAGAALLPFMLILTVFSRYTGALADRFGPRAPMAVGSLVTGLGYALLALPGIGGSYWLTFFPGILVMGIGMTLLVSPLTTAVMGSVGRRFSGLASGINNAVSRTAGLIVLAGMGVLAVLVFTAALGSALIEGGIDEERREQVLAGRADLAALRPPAEWPEEEKAMVVKAVDDAFLAAFRTIAIASAMLCWAGAVVAWLGVERKEDFRAPS